MPSMRFLRRVGGLRRVALIVICAVSTLLLAQNMMTMHAPPPWRSATTDARDDTTRAAADRSTLTNRSTAAASMTTRTPAASNRSTNVVQPDAMTQHIVVADKNIVFGERLDMCGLAGSCDPATHIAMSLYSGKNHDDAPNICVDGRLYVPSMHDLRGWCSVIARDLNKAGRGLNIVVVDPTSRQVLRVSRFDTYEKDSSAMEIFLEQIGHGHIVAVVSFDEASTKLTSLSKQLFYDMGSALVQNIKFRSSWYLVGQRGITGFTAFEQLNYAHNNEWATPVDARVCVPLKLDGHAAHVDPLPTVENTARRAFCAKYDGYEEFCDDHHIDEPLTVAPPLAQPTSSGVFAVPIVVVAGLAHNSLRLCLETVRCPSSALRTSCCVQVLRQPALNASLVLVVYDQLYAESAALALLFGVRHAAVNTSSTYMRQYAMAIDRAFVEFGAASELIVIEEELLLTIDFIAYMQQMLPVLRETSDVLAVSAWNDNSFTSTAFASDLSYRVGSNSMFGYMIRRDTYDKFVRGRPLDRSWRAWSLDAEAPSTLIVPDTSRIIRRAADALQGEAPLVRALFNRPRAFMRSAGAPQFQVAKLQSSALYDEHLRTLVSTGRPLNSSLVVDVCRATDADADRLPMPKTVHKLQAVVVYLADNARTWHRLAVCFGLLHGRDDDPIIGRGVFRGTLRFTSPPHVPVVLVAHTSPYYKLKPKTYTPVDLA